MESRNLAQSIVRCSVLVSFTLFFIWVVWPAPIDPVAYHPPTDKGFTGAFALNEKLLQAEQLPIQSGFGPEDVALDAEGYIYGGLQDGRIVKLSADGASQETFATIEGGRPLGLHFDKSGNLIVADAHYGLLSFAPDGTQTVLTTTHGGRKFGFTDDLDIAEDGTIYFSDASDTYSQSYYHYDLAEARGHGRLLSYNPATNETNMLLDNLYFANGVALSADEDFVLVNETGRYRVTRYWLKGDKAGTSEIFIDNLPGFPDGISHSPETNSSKGIFWLALASPRLPAMDKTHSKPWLKKLLSKLPASLNPKAIHHGVVVGLDENGAVKQVLHDPSGKVAYIVTSVEQVGDTLYLGSLEAPQFVRIKAPVGTIEADLMAAAKSSPQ